MSVFGSDTRTGKLHLRAVDNSGVSPSSPSYRRNLRLASCSYPPQVRCAVVHLRHDYNKMSLCRVQQIGRTPIDIRERSEGFENRRGEIPISLGSQGLGAAYATTPRAYQAHRFPYQGIRNPSTEYCQGLLE